MRRKAIHVGDKVKFALGRTKAVGFVKEDRGPIGVGGRRLFLVRYERVPELSVELPEEELEVIHGKIAV